MQSSVFDRNLSCYTQNVRRIFISEPIGTEMARDVGAVTESDVSEVLREWFSQVLSRLANVQRRVERDKDAIEEVGRGVLWHEWDVDILIRVLSRIFVLFLSITLINV